MSSKVYSAEYEDKPVECEENTKKKELIKFKGLPKSYVKNHLDFKMYKSCLMNQTTTKAKFWRMKTKNYKLSTKLQEKIALSSFDDKRLFELL